MATPIIIGSAGAFDLAINLAWKSFFVTGASSAKDARSYALGQKSNYWTVQTDSRKQVKSIGHAHFAKLPKGKRVLSLAQGFCANVDEHEQCILVMDTTMSDGRVWIVAVSDGQVVQGTDLLVRSEDGPRAVEELLQQWPGGTAKLYSNLEAEWLEDAEVLTWKDLLDVALKHAAASELTPIGSGAALNKNVLIVAGIGIALLAASEVYDRYKVYMADRAAAEAAANAPQLITPVEAWQQGLRKWQEKSRIGMPGDLSRVLEGLGTASLDIDGWEIRSAKCGRQLATWTCTLEYERRIASRSTTRDLLRALPSGWRASWGAMDKAALSFDLDADVTKPDPATLPRSSEVTLPALSFAQSHSQAFNTLEIAGAAAVSLDLPKQADGKPILVDVAQMKPVPVVLPVKAVGPLRSFALFEGLPVSWSSFAIEFSRNYTMNGDASNGFVMVSEAKGEIYAIRD